MNREPNNIPERPKGDPKRSEQSNPEDGPSRSSGVSERRRQQIRQAQKTHRERRIEHVKQLESEISSLRDKETQQAAYIETLEKFSANFNQLLQAKNVPYQVKGAIPVDKGKSSRVSVENPPTETSPEPQVPLDRNPSEGDAQLGIDFVLALEACCTFNNKDTLGSACPSHSAMLQSPLPASALSLPTHSAGWGGARPEQGYSGSLAPGLLWDVPAFELERLLDLSNQVQLFEEVTPIQAWARVRDLIESDSFRREDVNKLLQELKPLVICYGFGAMIPEDQFRLLLQSHSTSRSQQG